MGEMFDVEKLAGELELEKSDITELLKDFAEYLAKTLPDLELAVGSGDLKQCRSLAHAIKGSSGNLRVQQIYDLASKMQSQADAANLPSLSPLCAEMKELIRKFCAEAQTL